MSNLVSKAAELTFSQESVGDTFRVERTFTAEDVQEFAIVSGDFSPLHVDPEYAASAGFGGCVVHGILLASLERLPAMPGREVPEIVLTQRVQPGQSACPIEVRIGGPLT